MISMFRKFFGSATNAFRFRNVDREKSHFAFGSELFRRGLSGFCITCAKENMKPFPRQLSHYLKADSFIRAGHQRNSSLSLWHSKQSGRSGQRANRAAPYSCVNSPAGSPARNASRSDAGVADAT